MLESIFDDGSFEEILLGGNILLLIEYLGVDSIVVIVALSSSLSSSSQFNGFQPWSPMACLLLSILVKLCFYASLIIGIISVAIDQSN